MARSKTNREAFRIQEGQFSDAYAFVETLLTRKDISEETALESLLVFEALMQKLIDWGLDDGADYEIVGTSRLGDLRIKVRFEGPVYAAHEAAPSIEDRILDAHDDKIDYSYHSGRNEITILVSRSSRTSLFACAVAAACAIGVYLVVSNVMDADAQHEMLKNYVFPLERMYTNAMLMIGAPMTFFSLLKNITNTYIVSQANSGLRTLQGRTIATSAFAILLAVMLFILMVVPLTALENSLYSSGPGSVSVEAFSVTFPDVVNSITTASIFEPFETASPVPLMVVALLCAYALCSAGKYFDMLRQALMACYTLFSRMLHVTIAVLPFFCFLAMMDMLLEYGPVAIAELAGYFLAAGLGVILLLITYAIRLRAHGIKPIPFARKLGPLLSENLRIGSAINAAPYNTRYCSRVFKMDRELLQRNLPVLAEINLDGNCFLLMFFTLSFTAATDKYLSIIGVIGMGLLVLLLSLGAPNQPGSVLIGMLIITTFLHANDALCTALFLEAFFGGMQNLINVIGDIVMAAIEDTKHKALEG